MRETVFRQIHIEIEILAGFEIVYITVHVGLLIDDISINFVIAVPDHSFEFIKIPAFVLDRKFLTKLFVGEGSMLSVSAQDRRDIKRTIIQFPSVFKEPFTERFILTDFS